MVSKVLIQQDSSAANRKQQQQQKGKDGHDHLDYQQMIKKQIMQCNKGKTSKFKRSSFSGEEDGALSAILLLACIVCSPSA